VDNGRFYIVKTTKPKVTHKFKKLRGIATAKSFLEYRKNKGTKNAPLPDFFIGAHATGSSFDLITRDIKKFRTYFPQVKLIHPNQGNMSH